MKKNEVIGATSAIAVGKAIDYSRQQLTPAQHYKTFDDVLKDYSQARKGDVVFFSESIGQGKVHPVVITHHVKGEPHFLEFGIFNLNSGKLKDRLHAHTHINNKFKAENTTSLAGIYRNPAFDEAAFDAYIAKLPKSLKYNPLKIKQKAINCEGGTCVTFMDDVIRNSSKSEHKAFHFLPENLAKSLTEVLPPVKNYKRLTSSVGLGLAGYGATKLYNSKNTDDKIIGGSALVAGAAAQLPGIKEITNFGTGALTNATGAAIVEKSQRFLKGNIKGIINRHNVKKSIGTAALLASGALAKYVYDKV